MEPIPAHDQTGFYGRKDIRFRSECSACYILFPLLLFYLAWEPAGGETTEYIRRGEEDRQQRVGNRPLPIGLFVSYALVLPLYCEKERGKEPTGMAGSIANCKFFLLWLEGSKTTTTGRQIQ